MDRMTSLPVLGGILPLRHDRIASDIVAGITLAALAIPEVMGYTKISGTPVITGLYTMLVPAILYALFCSSRHLVVGADSATAAILASGLVGMAAAGSANYLALAGLLALMVGLMLMLAGAIGLGFMADFLSRTVPVGFLTGVGVQVALRALVELIGLPGHHHGTFMMLWENRGHALDLDSWPLTVAGLVIVVIVGSRWLSVRLKRNIPGAMIAVIGAIVASWALNLSSHMPVVGAVPVGLPQLALPQVDWSFGLVWQLLPTAFAMLVVILAQSAATARAYAARYHETLDETRDLTGLGLANIGAGLTGTFVVNGSPTKTEMVDGAGGRSQLALVAAAVVVLVTLLFLTRPLSYLPQAVLSAVVFLIGLKLIDTAGLVDIYRRRRSEFWVALATAAVVVGFGVEQGIVFAILFSLVVHTRHGYRPNNRLLFQDASGQWRAKGLGSGIEARPGLMVYRFGHSMYYANAQRMQDEISGLIKRADPTPKWVCIDASAVDDVDYTAAAALTDIGATLMARDISLAFAQDVDDINSTSRRQLQELFPDAPFFDSLNAAVAAFDKTP